MSLFLQPFLLVFQLVSELVSPYIFKQPFLLSIRVSLFLGGSETSNHDNRAAIAFFDFIGKLYLPQYAMSMPNIDTLLLAVSVSSFDCWSGCASPLSTVD